MGKADNSEWFLLEFGGAIATPSCRVAVQSRQQVGKVLCQRMKSFSTGSKRLLSKFLEGEKSLILALYSDINGSQAVRIYPMTEPPILAQG